MYHSGVKSLKSYSIVSLVEHNSASSFILLQDVIFCSSLIDVRALVCLKASVAKQWLCTGKGCRDLLPLPLPLQCCCYRVLRFATGTFNFLATHSLSVRVSYRSEQYVSHFAWCLAESYCCPSTSRFTLCPFSVTGPWRCLLFASSYQCSWATSKCACLFSELRNFLWSQRDFLSGNILSECSVLRV